MIYSSQRAQAVIKKDGESSQINYLPAGIHDNLVLASIRNGESPNGNKFVEFKFSDSNDAQIVHTEWEPQKYADATEESMQVKYDNQFARIDQILACFYPNPEDRSFTGSSFKEFSDWVVYKLSTANKTTLLRVKCVYNNNGYTTLPRYAKYTFIEPMTKVNVGESVITKLNIDQFDKPVVADVEQPNLNPFSTETTADSDELPF